METTVSQARLVDEKQVDPEKAYILSNVRIKNHGTGSEQTFRLVSAAEADIRKENLRDKPDRERASWKSAR